MMKIAIRGHESRGKEVIQILESLGGKNWVPLGGANNNCYYYIDNNLKIYCHDTKHVNECCKKYTLEEFEKEFPFKIGDKVTIIGLSDFSKVITKMIWDCDEILYSFEGLNNTWFGAKSLKKFKMKEERNVTLTLDKAKEWYKKGGELKEIALQAFTEMELNPLPRSWEEYTSKIRLPKVSIDRMPISSLPKKYIALCQLEKLRNCWRQGNIPQEIKYKIRKVKNIYTVVYGAENAFLSFCDRQTAEEFLECFKDLIEQAGDLI